MARRGAVGGAQQLGSKVGDTQLDEVVRFPTGVVGRSAACRLKFLERTVWNDSWRVERVPWLPEALDILDLLGRIVVS